MRCQVRTDFAELTIPCSNRSICCRGLLLLSLLLAFPGPVLKKLWYIPLALLLLYFCNVARVGLLAITNGNDYSQYFKYLKIAVNLITHVSLLVIFIVWLKISLKK